MNKLEQGFTLIELMSVVAIVGILTTIGVPSYTDYVVRSQVFDMQLISLFYEVPLP